MVHRSKKGKYAGIRYSCIKMSKGPKIHMLSPRISLSPSLISVFLFFQGREMDTSTSRLRAQKFGNLYEKRSFFPNRSCKSSMVARLGCSPSSNMVHLSSFPVKTLLTTLFKRAPYLHYSPRLCSTFLQHLSLLDFIIFLNLYI